MSKRRTPIFESVESIEPYGHKSVVKYISVPPSNDGATNVDVELYITAEGVEHWNTAVFFKSDHGDRIDFGPLQLNNNSRDKVSTSYFARSEFEGGVDGNFGIEMFGNKGGEIIIHSATMFTE